MREARGVAYIYPCGLPWVREVQSELQLIRKLCLFKVHDGANHIQMEESGDNVRPHGYGTVNETGSLLSLSGTSDRKIVLRS